MPALGRSRPASAYVVTRRPIGVLIPAPVAPPKQGSWWQLLDIRKMAQEEFDWWADNGPLACPNDGEPLRNAPPTESGASVEKYCPVDGWQFPRDYIRPQKM